MEGIIYCNHSQALVQGDSSSLTVEERLELNMSALIFKLPDEILLKIFTLIKEMDNDLKHLHKITQICHHLREVAIGAPLLWNRLNTQRHKYSLLLLDRSCSAPLDVHIGAPRSHLAPIVTPFLEHIERIQRLTCRTVPDHLKDIEAFLKSFGREALALEEMHIILDFWNLEIENGYTFSPTFFGAIGATPLLHTLELTLVTLDWRVFPVPQLSCLLLDHVRLAAPVSGDAFISALKGMPRLQELSMNIDDLQLHQYPPSPYDHPTYLPCLKNLVLLIRNPLGHGLYFLTYTVLRSLQHLEVHCRTDTTMSTYTNYAPIVKATRTLVVNGNFVVLRKLSFGLGWVEIFGASNTRIELRIPLSVIRTNDTGFPQLMSDVLACLTPIDSSPPVEVTLGVLLLMKDELVNIFGHLSHLKTIELHSRQASEFIRALCVPGDHSPGIPLPFPNLECLHIIAGIMPFDLDGLVHCLRERHRHGATLKKLSFAFLHNLLLDDVIERLRDIVVDIGRIDNSS